MDLAGTPAHWFAGGWLETGSGSTFELRTIVASNAASGSNVALLLNAPLLFANPNALARLFPGCDGTEGACKTKFSNFVNFGGHRFALRNLAIKAVEVKVSAGGKK